ncbi:MAG TPA: DinB family protein, partial [Ktedonobacterales bacterium]
MPDDNFTLTTFYTSWKTYQDRLTTALAPLTADQLALRPTLGLRSIGETALHIIGCRMYWFTEFLGEDGGEELKAYARWNELALAPGAPVPPAAELAQALGRTWQLMADCLARWSPADIRQTFPDEV